MNRKQFIQNIGASCKNWSWSWSFVNHKEHFVVFGYSEKDTVDNQLKILSEEWKIGQDGNKKRAYAQALNHIDLVQTKGYQLKVFKLEYETVQNKKGFPVERIKSFEQDLHDKDLIKIEGDWFAIEKMNKLNARRMVVVDLYAGSYNKENIGHELFNLKENPVDSNFYGYCPPWDGIEISKLGATNKNEHIDNVLVVYVTKKKDKSNNREIIAFCLNARVFKTGQTGEGLSRNFKDKDGIEKVSTYSVKSDNLYNLQSRFNKFEIKINDYNNKMFRRQRFYGGKYMELDEKIIGYIESIIENKELLDDDSSEDQEEIQKAEPASSEDIQNSANKPLVILNGSQGKTIAKDSRISKSTLFDANFTCIINPMHKTFLTKHKIPYMEGHHLIPCTVRNSEYFIKELNKNIDCFENIVCICPNCHREVHYGEWESKTEKIKIMLKKQQEKLKRVGLLITEEELLKLYK